MIVPGTLLAGRFEVRGELGRGGTAVVYLARDTQLDTQVALKVLHGHLTDDRVMRDRLRREVRTCRKLTHPHILPVYDLLEAEGHLFAVMAYHSGKTLVEYLSEHGPMPIDDVIRLGSQVASALEVAHLQGVVHRDIKPHNLLLDERGQVMLTDFGFARMKELATLTATGHGMGTPGYAAPETMAGARWEPRSDLYGLGAVLYEALTGTPPFPLSNPMATLRAQSAGPPPSPVLRRPEIPPWLNTLVLSLLQPQPDGRPDGPGAVLEILRHRRMDTWRQQSEAAPSGVAILSAKPAEVKSGVAPASAEVKSEVVPAFVTEAPSEKLPVAAETLSEKPSVAETLSEKPPEVGSQVPPPAPGNMGAETPPSSADTGQARGVPPGDQSESAQSGDLLQVARTAAWGLHDFYTSKGLFVPPPVVDLVKWTQGEGAARLAKDLSSGWDQLREADKSGRLRPRPAITSPASDSREVEWHYSVLVYGEWGEGQDEDLNDYPRHRRRRYKRRARIIRQEKARKLHQILAAHQLIDNADVPRLEHLLQRHHTFSVVDGLRREPAEKLVEELNQAGLVADVELTNLSRFVLRPAEILAALGITVLALPLLALLVGGVAPFLLVAFVMSVVFNQQMRRQFTYEGEGNRAPEVNPVEQQTAPVQETQPPGERQQAPQDPQPATVQATVSPAPTPPAEEPPVQQARVDATPPITLLSERNTQRTQLLRQRVLAQAGLPEVIQVDLLARLMEVASVSQALGKTALKLESTLATFDESRIMREVSTLAQRQKRQQAQGNPPDVALSEAISEQMRVMERLRQLEEEQTTCMARLMSLSAGLDAISLLLSEADRMDDVEEVRRFHEVMERLTTNLDAANNVTRGNLEVGGAAKIQPEQLYSEEKAR